MTRRRRSKTGKPRGGGGARNPRSLANLIPGGGAAGPGNTRALKYGAHGAALIADVGEETREIIDGIAAVVPVREGGGAPAADVLAIERLAVALKRWRAVVVWNDMHGRIDEKTGEEKPAAQFELRAEGAFERALDALGLTPQSRSKLGLRLVQAQVVAEDAKADREARERLDRRFEGLAAAPVSPDVEHHQETEPDKDRGEQVVRDAAEEGRVGTEEESGHSDGDQSNPGQHCVRSIGRDHARTLSAPKRPTE
jgi:hypothetical protein